ncbi:MAG: gamma-glutamyl-gamma-aminobutyrate hydrolase family protein [Synergistaceae bacterium]|jgi:putative glutamine amidotransferase|nr:gamma-glutamyl-gamma-aminobutyrate hydrolase family protein [Synergistaceae bacterium]
MKTKRDAAYPVVGITANIDEDKLDVQNIYSSYVNAIYHARLIPFTLPVPDITLRDSYADLAEGMVSRLSGLLLTGGDDVNATLYGEENFPFNGAFTEERDLFEMALCRAAVAQKKPVLGICRGIQLLNMSMGGTLFQDITKQNPGKALLMHAQKSPSYSAVHDAIVEPGSQVARILKTAPGGKVGVNSFHHQAVKDTAPGFVVSARASDGIIEAIEPKGRDAHPFTIGIQWHPERMWRHHEHAANLFAAFAEACGS